MLEESECGFAPKEVTFSDASYRIILILTCVYFSLVFLVVLLFWTKFFKFEHEMLVEKRELMLEDGIILGLPLVESFQHIGIGQMSTKSTLC